MRWRLGRWQRWRCWRRQGRTQINNVPRSWATEKVFRRSKVLQDGGSNPPATNTKTPQDVGRQTYATNHQPCCWVCIHRGTRIVWGKTGKIHHTKVQTTEDMCPRQSSKCLSSLSSCAHSFSRLPLSISPPIGPILSHYDGMRPSHTAALSVRDARYAPVSDLNSSWLQCNLAVFSQCNHCTILTVWTPCSLIPLILTLQLIVEYWWVGPFQFSVGSATSFLFCSFYIPDFKQWHE